METSWRVESYCNSRRVAGKTFEVPIKERGDPRRSAEYLWLKPELVADSSLRKGHTTTICATLDLLGSGLARGAQIAQYLLRSKLVPQQQLARQVIDDRIYFEAATITTTYATEFGRYGFSEDVGYYRGLGVVDIVTASDTGTLVVVLPEPSCFSFCAPVLLVIALIVSRSVRFRVETPYVAVENALNR